MATTVTATETALAELRWHSGKVLVDGEIRDPRSGATLDQVFPGNGRVVGKVARADARDVDAAVTAARAAFEDPGWREMNARDRRRLLLRYAQVIEQHRDELARLNTLDSGVTITMSSSIELIVGPDMAADMFEFYAGLCDKEMGDVLPVYPGRALDYTLREPLGVVACITAWNAPVYLYAAKVAPALACGNTVVVKPSEVACASTLRLAELALEAGIPKGVVNVVTGLGQECGEPLVTHRGVDGVSFTGGVATGRLIARMAADSLKRVVLELGGKSANIVFEDADIGKAAALAAGAVSFGMSGQGCAITTRALVQRSRLDEFTAQAAGMMAIFTVGDPFDPATMTGPIVSERQLERILGHVEAGRTEGAEVVCGGHRVEREGFYMEPTLLAGVRNDMTPAREEIFGPVLCVIPFDDEEEALRIANDSEFGLAGIVMTDDVRRAHRVAARLRSGTVGVNYYMAQPTTPFGGIRQSGYGREGSRHAIDDYSYVKNVYVDLR